MKVIFDKTLAKNLKEQYIVLELDTFRQEGIEFDITAYAIIDSDVVKLEDFPQLDNLVKLHNTMILEYKRKNFSFCEQALEHLYGKWSGELDSFYKIFDERVKSLTQSTISEDWDPVIYTNNLST